VKRIFATLAIWTAVALPAAAQVQQSVPAAAGARVTGKERLGDKASDNQRVNDCKVPPEKRGPVPRPTECAR
jgi:hypothetical protein